MSSEFSKTTETLLQISPLAPQSDGNEDTPKVSRGYLSENEVLALVEEGWGTHAQSVTPRMGAARSLLRQVLSGTTAGGYFVSFSGPEVLIQEIKDLTQRRKIEIRADELVRAIEAQRDSKHNADGTIEALENCFLELQRACSWSMTRALVALSDAEGRAELQRQ